MLTRQSLPIQHHTIINLQTAPISVQIQSTSITIFVIYTKLQKQIRSSLFVLELLKRASIFVQLVRDCKTLLPFYVYVRIRPGSAHNVISCHRSNLGGTPKGKESTILYTTYILYTQQHRRKTIERKFNRKHNTAICTTMVCESFSFIAFTREVD